MIQLAGYTVRDEQESGWRHRNPFHRIASGRKAVRRAADRQERDRHRASAHPARHGAQPFAGSRSGTYSTNCAMSSTRFDCERAREILLRAVPEYQPTDKVQDHVWLSGGSRVSGAMPGRRREGSRAAAASAGLTVRHTSGVPIAASGHSRRPQFARIPPLAPIRACPVEYMRVTIFGSGYVGLVTGACLADAGNDVLCVDVDAKKIEALKQGDHSHPRAGPRRPDQDATSRPNA